MIAQWCDAYESGSFPEGEHTVGQVVHGRPPLSTGTAAILVKVPLGLKLAIERRAEQQGISTSAFTRSALTDKLLAS